MIDKKFIQSLKNDYQKQNEERRRIISLSNAVLHDSKRAIFAIHRGDNKKASELLKEIEEILGGLSKKFGYARLIEEGAYKTGAEEYVEAKMFFQVMSGKKITKIKEASLHQESVLGGVCDLTGELVRMAINQAAEGNLDKAKEIKEIINDIMSELVEFDMTGYLRTKYDQAKTNLRKIEQINYEIKIRK